MTEEVKLVIGALAVGFCWGVVVSWGLRVLGRNV